MSKVSTPKSSSSDLLTRKPSTRGRPAIKTFPDPIPDTLENVALSVLSTPPKKDHEWEYGKKGER